MLLFRIICLALLVFPVLPAAGAGTWPPVQDGLTFAWSTAFEPAHAFDPQGNQRIGWQFTPTGRAHLDHNGALVPDSGGFYAEGLGHLIPKDGEGTVVFSVRPNARSQRGPVLRLGEPPLLAAMQEDQRLRCEFKGDGGDAGLLAQFPPSERAASVGIAWDADGVSLYINGEIMSRENIVLSRLNSESQSLTLGLRKGEEGANWRGIVDGIAVYARALSGDEVRRLHESYAAKTANRDVVPQVRARVRLAGKSTVMTPRELAPYTQGLCVYRYDVLEILEGDYNEKHVHVAHWMVLDQTVLPFSNIEIGTEHELTLELLDDNPQLASENLSDDIVDDFTLPYFYDAGGRAIAYAAPED